MHLETWAEISLLIFGGIFSLVAVGLLGAIAFAVSKLVSLLDKVTRELEPVILKTTSAIDTVQRVTTNIGVKADQVLVKGEALTDDVSGRVEKTAGVVQSAVITPLINVSSIITAFPRVPSIYAPRDKQRCENGTRDARKAVQGRRPRVTNRQRQGESRIMAEQSEAAAGAMVEEIIVVGVPEEVPVKSGGGFLSGLLLGSALGALLALLYAPQGGDETRGLIKQKTNDYSDLTKSKAGDLSGAAKAKVADITDKTNDTIDSAKAKAAETADAVKAKAAGVADTAKTTVTSITTQATDAASSVKDNAQGLVDKGKGIAEDQKSRISDAVGAGKQAAQETKEQLTAQAE